MGDPDRHELGLARYREVYGDDATVLPPGTAFFDLMIEQLFAEVWTRPALGVPARRLLTMGVLAAQSRFEVLGLQFRRTLDNGELSVEEVREIVVHLVPYVGYGASGELFRVSETAIAEHQAATVSTDPA
jgi:4-carboxymuconolactone decarboxylase